MKSYARTNEFVSRLRHKFPLSAATVVGILALVTIMTGAAIPAAAHAAEELVLQFGIYTAEKPTAMIRSFKPLTEEIESHMSKTLGKPVRVRFKVAPDYDEGIKMIAQGKVDFSRFGPVSYIEASRINPDLTLLAVESKGGEKMTYGILAVREDSPVKKTEELKGKSVAFGNELSTIGRYLAQQHLLQHGLHAKDLKSYEYLGRHDAVGAAVGAGRFDAGALKEETFSKLKSKGTPLRELARFPNAPQAWIGRKGLPPEVAKALTEALYNVKNKKALDPLDADRLVAGEVGDYALIRDAMEVNSQFFN